MSNSRRISKIPASRAALVCRILIACDDDGVAGPLRTNLVSANFVCEHTKNIQSACDQVRAGNFRMVFVAAMLPDGSWRLLRDFAASAGLDLSFIVMARSFDIDDWAESFRYGAFDVLDILHEIPKAAEIATEALLTAGAQLSRAASSPSNF